MRCSPISLTFPLMHIILQTLRIRLKLAVTLWFLKQNVVCISCFHHPNCLPHPSRLLSFSHLNNVTVVKRLVMQYCYESHDSSGKWQDAFCATVAQFPIETRSVPHRFSTTSQQMSWDLITPGRAYTRMWRIIASWYQIFTWALDGEPFGCMLSRVSARNIVAVAQNSQVKHVIDKSSVQRLIASVVEEGYQIPVSLPFPLYCLLGTSIFLS